MTCAFHIAGTVGGINALGYVPENGWCAPRRYRCENCLDIFAEADVLQAQNPFDPDDPHNIIQGCPHCLDPENFLLLCDFPDCIRAASSGEPTLEGGYVHRCHEHTLWAFAKRAEFNHGQREKL